MRAVAGRAKQDGRDAGGRQERRIGPVAHAAEFRPVAEHFGERLARRPSHFGVRRLLERLADQSGAEIHDETGIRRAAAVQERVELREDLLGGLAWQRAALEIDDAARGVARALDTAADRRCVQRRAAQQPVRALGELRVEGAERAQDGPCPYDRDRPKDWPRAERGAPGDLEVRPDEP